MRFEPGDIFACYGRDWISRLISLETACLWAPKGLRVSPSHVAIVGKHHGRPVWIESTTLSDRPCLVNGHTVNGCQLHDIDDCIQDYIARGGRIELYRLSEIDRLSPDEIRTLNAILIGFFVTKQVGYDYGGALISGTRIARRLNLFSRKRLDDVFCSELIAAVLMRLGRLSRSNPTRYNPGRLLRTLVNEGTYRHAVSIGDEYPDVLPLDLFPRPKAA